jgi:C-terminal processing protease CtpA/Prc
MICSGFAPGSRGKASGVRPGDILKAVDGTSVLQMKVDRKTGKHGVVDLLIGGKKSVCNLVLLRVEKGVRNVIHGKATADEVRLSEISVCVPREHLL